MGSIVSKEEVTSIDDVEFRLIKEGKMAKSYKDGYINNRELYEEMVKYHQRKMDAIENGKPVPPLNNVVGKAIIQIATRRCNSRMYVGYTNNWKEEMISNAITLATIHGHNFNPAKSENPFAYFTQICDNAIKEQLKKEKRQLYIRYKVMDQARGFQATEDENLNDDHLQHDEVDIAYEDRLKFIDDYEERNFNKARPEKELSEEDRGVFRLEDIEIDAVS